MTTQPPEDSAGRSPDIDPSQFSAVDMRVGRIVEVRPFPEARKPAYVLRVDGDPAPGTRIA